MSDLDSKARVAAAYQEIDKELHRRKLRAMGACSAAVLLSSALVWYFCWTLPVGPTVPRPGIVIRTMQIADDTAHDVRLVVALDRGPSVVLRAVAVVPIGARVIVGERKNRFGWSKYAFIGRAPESNGR